MAKPVHETAASTDLITIETLKAIDVFKPGAVEKLITDLEAKVRAIPMADHTTKKGRDEIVSLAHKVTRSKTALDELGKTHVADLKKAAGVVDADRRLIRLRLDDLKDEVRRPVTEYEEAEEKRIATHTANMETLQALDTFAARQDTIHEINSRLSTLSELEYLTWEEFSDGANRLLAKMKASLTALGERAVKQNEERAELERLRKAEADRQEAQRKIDAERAQKERDERIAAQAYQEAKDKAAEDSRRAEAERTAAIARAEKAERDAKDAAEKAERDKAVAFEQAERNRKAAVEAERKRVADAQAAEEAATKKREANKAHLARVNNAALADLMKVPGVTDKIGKAVIIAIASGKVPNITVNY